MVRVKSEDYSIIVNNEFVGLVVPGRGLGMEILYLRLLDKMNDEKIFMTSECAIMPMWFLICYFHMIISNF